ncbi:MAG: YceI family protein [Chitinophagales bacterium]|nr:YceI family protein [Chitinophagales bacterium]
MKTLNALLLSFVVLFAACNSSQSENKVEATNAESVDTTANAAPAGAAFVVQKDRSVINWKGSNKFTPKAHAGTLLFSDGSFTSTDGQVTAGKFTADMNSMTSAGDEYTGGAAKVGDLIGHLKSADFFDVANFPNAAFEITSIAVVADQPGVTHNVTGNLTIKGITKSVTFPANVTVAGNELTAIATFTIDRSQWEVKYGSETFFLDLAKDKLIKNEIELGLNVVAVQG